MGSAAVSAIFDPTRWREVDGFDFSDITYHRHIGPRTESDSPGSDSPGSDSAAVVDLPTVRIAFHRPEVRNAFRPE